MSGHIEKRPIQTPLMPSPFSHFREIAMTNRTIPMASTVVDSILFRDAFGTAGMRALFSDHALVQRYIDVEVALAKAEARVGVIPAEAAEVIARESSIERIDFDHMREETDIVGYPILPLVHQLVEMCGEHCPRVIGDAGV